MSNWAANVAAGSKKPLPPPNGKKFDFNSHEIMQTLTQRHESLMQAAKSDVLGEKVRVLELREPAWTQAGPRRPEKGINFVAEVLRQMKK